jgi:hypothetical protein
MKEISTDDEICNLNDIELKDILRARVNEFADYCDHFSDLVKFVLVVAGDRLEDLDRNLGFPASPGATGQFRRCDAFEEHPSYYELVYVLSADGSGVIVFIEKGGPISSELLAELTGAI